MVGDRIIYLDNNATTQPDPKVVEVVFRCLKDDFANPSSHHVAGLRVGQQVEEARAQVSSLLDCRVGDVVFTSGATEANNLAMLGLWEGSRDSHAARDTILIGATEHPAVREVGLRLARYGARIITIPVDDYGVVDLSALRDAADDRTLLVSIMAANNETGTLAPLESVVSLARSVGAFVHSDATQMVGRLPFSFINLDLDLASLSAHKMYGPKGVGALIARRGVPILQQMWGGGHERDRRSGTLNSPGIVGFGVAAELAQQRFEEADQIRRLRDRLHTELEERLEDVFLNGHPVERLPNTVNLRFRGADAEAVMASMPRVACSAGSACSSAVPAPSPVLTAMGLSHLEASESLRFGLGRTTIEADIEEAVPDIVDAVRYVRSTSALEAT